MDLRQLAAAFRAHKVATALGLGVAVCLAFLAYVRVQPFGSDVLQYRQPIVWGSKITLQLTQEGFPEGRVQDVGSRREALIGLTPLYARLATTDPVKRRMRQLGPVYGGVKVEPLVDQNRSSLPLIKITGYALTKSSAMDRAQHQAQAFIDYVTSQQRANGVSPRNRVLLQILSGPSKASVVVPRKVTLPVVVFLSFLVITAGVVLVLENLRKANSRRSAASEPPEVLRTVPESSEPTSPREPEPALQKQHVSARAVALPPPRRTLRVEPPDSRPSREPTADGDGAAEQPGVTQKTGTSRRRRP